MSGVLFWNQLRTFYGKKGGQFKLCNVISYRLRTPENNSSK